MTSSPEIDTLNDLQTDTRQCVVTSVDDENTKKMPEEVDQAEVLQEAEPIEQHTTSYPQLNEDPPMEDEVVIAQQQNEKPVNNY